MAIYSLILGSILALCLVYAKRELLSYSGNIDRYSHPGANKSWAIVTGASDGIGRAFAEELLKKGLAVLLHGRNGEKLAQVKDDLAKKYDNRNIRVVVADAGRDDHPEEDVLAAVKELPGPLTVLINNVGGISTKPVYVPLADATTHQIDHTLKTNIRFPTQLTHRLLPLLVSNRPSLVLNCGSLSADVASPYITVYAGTKGFIHTWTRSLQSEMAAERLFDIEILGVAIGNTITNGNSRHMPFTTITAQECAQAALAKVGCGKAVVYAHWKHALSAGIITILPDSWKKKIMIREMTQRRNEEAFQDHSVTLSAPRSSIPLSGKSFDDPSSTRPRNSPTISDGVFSVFATTTIDTSPQAVYEAILKVNTWKSWNSFVFDVTLPQEPTVAPADHRMTEGMAMTFHVAMSEGFIVKSKIVCSLVEPLRTSDKHAPPVVTRICWTLDNRNSYLPNFLMRSERVSEIEEIAEGKTLYRTWEVWNGPLAHLLKRALAEVLKSRFEDWCRDLKKHVENLR